MTAHDAQNPVSRRAILGGACLLVGVLIAMAIAAGMNQSGWTPALSFLAIDRLFQAAPLALVFVLAGLGMGWWWSPITRGLRSGATVRAGLGFGTLLSGVHLVGILGLLSAWVMWIMLIAGVVSLGIWIVRERQSLVEHAAIPGLGWWATIPAAGVLLAASVSMPGVLWGSEFGGYDALSYHLPLAREWAIDGRIWPVEHSVYSYLPSFVEAAFAGMGVVIAPGGGDPLTPSGTWLASCQLFHAAITVFAAWAVGRVAIIAGGSAIAGSVAAGLTLAAPWSVVVGSLAYNEMGVVWLGAAGLIVAMQTEIQPILRGTLAGALVAFACGCKPTAIFMVAPVAGLFLLISGGWRGRMLAVGWAMLAGTVGIAPWLVRNAIDSGNPVFPQMTSLLGMGHWSAEQAARFASAHVFEGTLGDRLGLVVFADPADPAGARHRGLMHPQWFWFFPLAAVSAVVLAIRATLLPRVLVIGLVAQLGAWLFLTHVQSRFLVPCLITAAPMIGLAVDRIPSRFRAREVTAGLVILAFSLSTLGLWSRQNEGRPSIGIAMDGATPRQADLPPGDRSARALIYELPPGSRVLLVGSATPLYDPPDVMYATTWDNSPLTRAIAEAPDGAARWNRSLREAGVTHVLVDFSELRRLEQSGWTAPGLTEASVAAWLRDHARPIAVTPRLQQVLAEVMP